MKLFNCLILTILVVLTFVCASQQSREIVSLSCNGYLRLLKGSLLESNINIGLALSATNYAIEQARLRVNQCRCPSITERNFQRQYVPGVEGFLWNSMKGRPSLDNSCPAQSDAANNWAQMSNNVHFATISSCNLNDVSNGSPCLFSVGLGSAQIQVALASCPSETSGNRATFGIPQRLPFISINCKGDDCDKIAYPCQQDSDCGGNSLTCWDVPNNVAYSSSFQFNFGLFVAGIYNQLETCKTPEQLVDGLMKAILTNHWSQTSTKTFSSIKMCGPKLSAIMSPGTTSLNADCTATTKTRSISSTIKSAPTAVVTQIDSPTINDALPASHARSIQEIKSVYYCGGVDSNSTSVCNGNGYCSLVAGNIGVCKCNSGYGGSLCSQPIMCGAFNSTNPAVCSGRGSCLTVNYNPLAYCSCNSGYSGANCEFSISCPACQNGGTCYASLGVVGKCQCTGTKYTGSLCEKPVTCNGVVATSSEVCSGHGSCVFATPNFEDAATTSTEGVCSCNYGYVGPNCNTTTSGLDCTYTVSTATSWDGILSDGSSAVANDKKTATISLPVDPLFPTFDTNKYTLLLKYDCNGVLQLGPNIMTVYSPNINSGSNTIESVINSMFSCNAGWTSELRRVLVQPYNVKAWLALLSSNSNTFSAGSWTISPMQRIVSLLSLSTLNVQMPSTCTYSNYEASGCRFTYTNLFSLLDSQIKIHVHTSRCSSNPEGIPNLYMFCEGTLCKQLLNVQTCTSDSDCGDNIKCTNPLKENNIDTNLLDILFLGNNNTGCVNNNNATYYAQIGDAMDYAMGRAKKGSNDFKICFPNVNTVSNTAKNWADAAYSIASGTITLNGLVNYDGPSPNTIVPPTALQVSAITAAGATFSWTATVTTSSSLTYSLIVKDSAGNQVVSVSNIAGTSYTLTTGLSPITTYTAYVTAVIPANGATAAQQSAAISIEVTTISGSSGSNRIPGSVGSLNLIVKINSPIPKGGIIYVTLPTGYTVSLVQTRAVSSSMTITDANGNTIPIKGFTISNGNTIAGSVDSQVIAGRISISLGSVKNPDTASTSASYGSITTTDSAGGTIEKVTISLPPVNFANVSGSLIISFSMLLISILAAFFMMY